MRHNVLPWLLAFASQPIATAGDSVSLPSGWIVYSGTPQQFGPDRACAAWSATTWDVSADHGRVVVTRQPAGVLPQEPLPIRIPLHQVLASPVPEAAPPGFSAVDAKGVWLDWSTRYAERHARRRVVRLRSGWLVGFDAGEYGGSLWWGSTLDGQGVKVIDDNVVAIIPQDDGERALVVTGLSHLGVHRGSAWKFHPTPNPAAVAFGDLGAAPRAALDEGRGAALVLTDERLLVVEGTRRIRNLCEVAFGGLYPRSLARARDGGIYVGMRHFVARIGLAEGLRPCHVTWLVRRECQRFDRVGEDCRCHQQGR